MTTSEYARLLRWLGASEDAEVARMGDMASREEQLCREALDDLISHQNYAEHLERRAQALLGHPSENALEEILTTLETLFSK
jgi:hypothetical protein